VFFLTAISVTQNYYNFITKWLIYAKIIKKNRFFQEIFHEKGDKRKQICHKYAIDNIRL